MLGLVVSSFLYNRRTVFIIVYNLFYSVDFFLSVCGVKIVCVDPVHEISNRC